MSDAATLNAATFKAQCLDLLDQVNTGRLGALTVTKRGRPVAVVSAPPAAVASAFGALRGSVVIPDGTDLTAPALDDTPDAARGRLHR